MGLPGGPRRLSRAGLRYAWAGVAVLGLIAGPVDAATFGHARLASAAGEPLEIVVPVTRLTEADLQVLAAQPAPQAAWTQAGLTPPVALESLKVSVARGPGGTLTRVLRIHSPQAFSGTLADLLLDVKTATGAERYQVSLVAPGPVQGQPVTAPAAAPRSAQGPAGPVVGKAPARTSTRRVPQGHIRVKPGDMMFGIARRHAVRGVSVYQLMLALQRANPQAFIHGNINLVLAGKSLAVPTVADMLSISDAEARRQFVAQLAAYNRLRGRQASGVPVVGAGEASAGSVSGLSEPPAAAPRNGQTDELRLSEGSSDRADARTARGHALQDAESRLGQLQENVQNLSQALQAQGEAARNVAADGARAIGGSIEKIAGAISQASHEAAAQANDRTEAAARAAAAGQGSGAAAVSGPDSAAGAQTAGVAPGAVALAGAAEKSAGAKGAANPANPDSPAVGSAPGSNAAGGAGAASGGGAAAGAGAAPGKGAATGAGAGQSGDAAAGGSAASSAGASPAGNGASAGDGKTAGHGAPAGSGTTTADAPAAGHSAADGAKPAVAGSAASPGGAVGGLTAAPANEAQAHANAVSAEKHASEETRHRVNWLQDHLLGVMTALLALIVFIIAWLLRRANAARDDSETESRVAEAMVRERLKGVDLELPTAGESPTKPGV